MIWDRSRTHRSKLMKKYLSGYPEIQIESLPAYAPEVNPEEFCHGNVKRSVKNAVFPSKQDIRKKLNRRFSALRKRPTVLLACFHHAGLALTNFGERQELRLLRTPTIKNEEEEKKRSLKK